MMIVTILDVCMSQILYIAAAVTNNIVPKDNDCLVP